MHARITYPEDLPIVAHKREIARAIASSPVAVVCGDTGSGKSTQLPKICLEIGRGANGQIGMTQPRRIAARSIAGRLAEELGTAVGQGVGFKVRHTDRTSPDALVKVMTDGILLAETQGDRRLAAYDTIIIDEAHERSLNIDFLLGYLKQLVARRPDLKVVVTSATIDPERFRAHFDGAPVVEVSGRTYPVEVRYRPPADGADDRDMVRAIVAAVDELAADGTVGRGDVLVFLSGEREIREAAEALRAHHPPETEILPLYARLSAETQHRVFEPHPGRRIILATNVAETSLTVPGIRAVVDTGLARISRYSARSKVQRLPIEPISQASAKQRAGRCGRLGPGVCIRLYDEDDFEQREAYTPPEIVRTHLASVILRMKTLGLGDVGAFPFIEPPRRAMIRDGYATLRELGAIDERDRLTSIGRELGRLPVDPRIGRMILAAREEGCLTEVLRIAAGLTAQDPRDRPLDKQQAADQRHRELADPTSDFGTLLTIWDAYHRQREGHSWSQVRAWCRDHYLSFRRMREWVEVHQQLRAIVTRAGARPNAEPAEPDCVHRAVLHGLLANFGRRGERRAFDGARGSTFHLFPGSVLFRAPPKWVMAAEIVETTRRYARCVGRIQPEWLEAAAGHLVKRSYADPRWEASSGQVVAAEKVSLYGVEIVVRRRKPYGGVDPVASREIFIHAALVEGELDTNAPFLAHNQGLIEELRAVESKRRKRDVLVDAMTRYAFYDARLPAHVHSRRAFEGWWGQARRATPELLHMTRADLTLGGAGDVDHADFPSAIEVEGAALPLVYHHEPGAEDDGVTLSTPLALLNRLPAERIEWLVPALLEEKVTALIRGLPKSIRRHFVPVPDCAAACAERLEYGVGSLGEALAAALAQMADVTIPPDAWKEAALPPHLRMRIEVLDDDGRPLGASRDLEELRRDLAASATESFGRLSDDRFDRVGIETWDFGDLPERVEVTRGGARLAGYPAVVDDGSTVGLRLLDSESAAAVATRRGLRRLFTLACQDELRFHIEHLPGIDEMRIAHAPHGPAAALADGLVALIIDRAFLADDPFIRSEAAFAARLEEGWRRLGEATFEVADLVESILRERHALDLALEARAKPVWAGAVADVRAHLTRLLPPGFLVEIPSERLAHVPRYLEATRRRLEKLAGGTARRDAEHAAEIQTRWAEYEERRGDHAARGVHDPALETYRWMLEELRVSLFAQELRTAVPVSAKRLDEQWGRVQS